MKKKRSFIEEARRNQILDITLELVSKHGYQHTTIDMIANKAGTTKSVIYYHFGGKVQLTTAMWKLLVDNLYEYRKAFVEKQATATEKLNAYIDAHLKFVFHPKQLQSIGAIFEAGVYLAKKNGRDGMNPWSPSFNARCFKFISEILKEGQKTGEFGCFDSDEMAPVIQGSLDGVFLEAYYDPDGVNWKKCKKVITDMTMLYVKRKN